MADKATAVSFRYGDRSAHEVFRGVTAEITVDLDTPTLWVHTGDSSKPGTPLAREDLANVTQAAITGKNIAKSNLMNVNLADADLIEVRRRLSGLNYASRDLNDITEAAYTKLDTDYARKSLDNVQKIAIIDKIGTDTYAATDLANVTQATIANKGIAKTDLTNVTVATIKEKGIASNTLDNVTTLDDTVRATLDLQKTSNIVDLENDTILNNGTYPTAFSVKRLIDAIPPIIRDIVVDTDDDESGSNTQGQITMVVSKALGNTPTIKLINGNIIEGSWTNSNVTQWVFTPLNTAAALQILTENWVISL